MNNRTDFPEALILSLETSGTTCGLALSQGPDILAEYALYIPNMHDRHLAELSRAVLADCECEVMELDAVAVSAGPGSFTGLRIGTAFAKALCFQSPPECIAVPTLYTFAWAAREFAAVVQAPGIVAAIPSHKELVYVQEFSPAAQERGSIAIMERNAFAQQRRTDLVYCGPAIGPDGPGYTQAHLNQLQARFVAKAAHELYRREVFTSAAEFTPMYVQEFIPKIRSKQQ